jgi:HD-like signal output (HDOD) protein
VGLTDKKLPPDECEVGQDDLQHLKRLHDLLAALNDPYVSRRKIEMLTSYSKVLSARVMRHARARQRSIDSLGAALTLIGNRGLETVLLQFLEDLTIYKGELEASQSEGSKSKQ